MAALAFLFAFLSTASSGSELEPELLQVRGAFKGALGLSRERRLTFLSSSLSNASSRWRLRVEPKLTPKSWVTVAAAYEVGFQQTSSASFGFAPSLSTSSEPQNFRGTSSLEGALSQGASWALRHELDRLTLSLHLPRVEINVGRQAVGWGRGLFFGAIDVFAPFTPLEFDREWRRGIDAARVEIQLLPKVSAEVLGVLGPTLSDSALFGRVRGYFGPLDAEVLGGTRAQDTVVGGAVSASILDAEVHGELSAWVLPRPWPYGGTLGDRRLILKAVLGASYQFAVGQGLRAAVEYHYSGFGLRFPVNVLTLASDREFAARFARGDLQILGRNLVAVTVGTSFALSLAPGLAVMVDPQDGSGVISPTLNWDLSDAASVQAAGYVGWGALPANGHLSSQLGAVPFTLLIQLRVYEQRGFGRKSDTSIAD